jgi:hypothetical protein
MKKIWKVVLVFASVLVFAGLGAVGPAHAQESPALGSGPLHDYMMAASAEALDLTLAALEARLASGETLYEIALDQGISADRVAEVLRAARANAIDAALADGVIDQRTADWMKSHGFGRGGYGLGPGNGPCHGTGTRVGPGMMRGGRW